MATAPSDRPRHQRARELITKARATNAQRDKGEAEVGFATPLTGPVDLSIRTIICALMAGIVTSDWNAVAEGYAMLCDLHEKVAGKPYDPIMRGDL